MWRSTETGVAREVELSTRIAARSTFQAFHSPSVYVGHGLFVTLSFCKTKRLRGTDQHCATPVQAHAMSKTQVFVAFLGRTQQWTILSHSETCSARIAKIHAAFVLGF
jgi:hypothetical protein